MGACACRNIEVFPLGMGKMQNCLPPKHDIHMYMYLGGVAHDNVPRLWIWKDINLECLVIQRGWEGRRGEGRGGEGRGGEGRGGEGRGGEGRGGEGRHRQYNHQPSSLVRGHVPRTT